MTASHQAMTASRQETRKPRREHSVPWFWPFAAAIEFGEEGMRFFQANASTSSARKHWPSTPDILRAAKGFGFRPGYDLRAGLEAYVRGERRLFERQRP
jgi:nucleoside-diphosphate-sugar epimerase